ncbi:MAG: histidine kinase dimerization/phospho-acceptor domain-containing protein, partial [Candidatus Margulisiibacteriota bacterium]
MAFNTGTALLTSLVSLLLGLFVFLKGKDKPANITLGLSSLALMLWCFGQLMGGVVVSKVAVLFWTRLGIGGAIFIPVFFLHFVLVLIDRYAKYARALFFAYGFGFILLLLDFTPLLVAGVAPVFGFRYYPVAGAAYAFFALFVLLCFGFAFYRLAEAYKNEQGEKKNQLLYIIIGSVTGFLGGFTSFFPVWKINFPVLSDFAFPFFLLTTIYAIVKHRLLDISIIIREGLIYSFLTLLFAGFYALAVLLANYFFSHFVTISPALTTLLVVFASVLIFRPLRDRIQRMVDRLFFRGEYRYQQTINDLSVENRRLFYELLRADKLAALGTLSAGMAHEIKNPLASIKGMTQVLEENMHDASFLKKYHAVVERQIERIDSIVDKLLKFGRPQQLVIKDVDLVRVIEEVLNLLENQIKRAGITVEKQIVSCVLQGDGEQLSQVFMNLFLNAIQAEAPVIKIRVQGVRYDKVDGVSIEI